jgi:hypothetical protein
VARLVAALALVCGATLGYLASGRATPSIAHVIFIPSVLIVGVVIGFVLGGRAARDAAEGARRAEAAKAARRAAREAARQAGEPPEVP